MKVTLRQEGEVVCRLEVLDDGALVLRVPEGMALRELNLSVGDSRRIAGAILENSIKGTVDAVRADLKRQAREQLNKLFADDDDAGDDDDEAGA